MAGYAPPVKRQIIATGDACWRSGVRRPRVRPRQPGSREASGHRPPSLRRAALQWAGRDRTSGAKAPR
jgi:hypothetical protein